MSAAKLRVYKRGAVEDVLWTSEFEDHCCRQSDVSNNRLTIDHGCYYFDPKIERRSALIPMAIVELKWADIDLQVLSKTLSLTSNNIKVLPGLVT